MWWINQCREREQWTAQRKPFKQIYHRSRRRFSQALMCPNVCHDSHEAQRGERMDGRVTNHQPSHGDCKSSTSLAVGTVKVYGDAEKQLIIFLVFNFCNCENKSSDFLFTPVAWQHLHFRTDQTNKQNLLIIEFEKVLLVCKPATDCGFYLFIYHVKPVYSVH